MKENNDSRSRENSVGGVAAVMNANAIEQTQWPKYHSKQGHGFAAEDANALHDTMRGKHVDRVGCSNELNGADRIVDGQPIQTKYCRTAYESVNSAFKDGVYRYSGQKLEVPRDQFNDAVKILARKICQGKVPGVTDPKMAESMLVRGSVTQREAVQIAKAGNIDSLKFDAKTQAVACELACGLSFAVTYFRAKSSGMSHGEALKVASKQAAKSGGTTLVTGVVAHQLLRTKVGAKVSSAASSVVAKPAVQAAMKTEAGRQLVTKTATAIAGKQVAGATAAKVVTKAMRSNALVSGVAFVGTTIPDVVKYCRGEISGRECAENTASNAAGFGGGWAGASTGAAIGSAICPGVGTVVGSIVGGIGAGLGASAVVRKIFDWFD